jgi:hypothetical protein
MVGADFLNGLDSQASSYNEADGLMGGDGAHHQRIARHAAKSMGSNLGFMGSSDSLYRIMSGEVSHLPRPPRMPLRTSSQSLLPDLLARRSQPPRAFTLLARLRRLRLILPASCLCCTTLPSCVDQAPFLLAHAGTWMSLRASDGGREWGCTASSNNRRTGLLLNPRP